jgi:hypothetical protein
MLQQLPAGQADATGTFSTSTSSISLGFRPSLVLFYANLHLGSRGSEYSSGPDGNNAFGYSRGLATWDPNQVGGTKEVVTGMSCNSGGTERHHSFTGDQRVVYLIETSNSGSNIDGYATARSTFDDDGFGVTWIESSSAANVTYQAYR